jgi:hypothetical protein
LSAHLSELTELAAGDLDMLRAAADRLRVTDLGVPELERTAQHIAFAFVSAAFARATHQETTN